MTLNSDQPQATRGNDPRKIAVWAIVWMTILILYQMTRIIIFVAEYGSVEHDGGWALGIARQVAEQGRYTSLTSTLLDPQVQSGLNYDEQFTIQDAAGREYFFIGQTIGPGIVLPTALTLKLFGFGFWQTRLAPLLFFALFLGINSVLLYRIQGLLSVTLFHLYLFFFPQLYVFLGYEILGEMPSMVYILLSFVVFLKAIQVESRADRWFFLSGIFAGLAINTRLATLLVFSSLALLWLILYWQKKVTFRQGLLVAAGEVLVAALWQVTIFISLMRISDFATYQQHLFARFEFFFRSLEGITPIAEGMELFLLKALILSELSYASLGMSLILGLTTAIGGGLLVWQLWQNPVRRNPVLLLWLAWLIYTVWFLNGPKNAWVRYYWYGLVWMAMLLSLMFGHWLQTFRQQRQPLALLGALFIGGLSLVNFSSQPQALSPWLTTELVEVWQQRQHTTRDTYLPWIIVPRAEQKQVVEFIKNVPPETHIFYPEGHKTAEISALTNRIFYSIPRRNSMGPRPDDLVIVGPAIISPWMKNQQQRLDILETTRRECPQILLETPNYIICAIGAVN